jgi:LuxR family maltose regulon positive regulatory protein
VAINSLLSTKYQIPLVGARPIQRCSLLQKLNDGFELGRRLILVCAPAGYGKTTLVCEWVNQIGELGADPEHPAPRVAWLTCDPEDNDLARYLTYLVAALRQVHPELGEGLLASFHASKSPAPGTLATLLINDLAEIAGRLILVLDDVHTLSDQPIHDFLTFLIEHQPPQVCLVLITRADPALPLARWRGRGQLDEIRQNDLAFTQSESSDFLKQTMGVTLTSEQLASLERRTEGWPAGLQLAGLSLRTSRDISTFIETFSGGYEYIADYLADEVLAQQPDALKSFLLQTSILERLSAPLCAAVTGDANAQAILETLRDRNLFLVALDHRKEWYRYHALFADLLRNRFYQSQGHQADELHLRASRWYQENGFTSAAIEHAFAGHAAAQAAGLIEQAVEPIFISGQVSTLLRWLEMLPVEVKNNRPILWVFYGLALIWGGKSSAAVKPFLPDILSPAAPGKLSGGVYLLQALHAMIESSPSDAARLAEKALQELPLECYLFRCLAADTLGMTNILLCETQAAIRAFELTSEIAAQAGYAMFEIMARSHLGGLRFQQGQLRATQSGYQGVLALADHTLGKSSPITGNILLGLGELAREWHDPDGALRYFLEAAEKFAQFSELGVPIAYLSIARVKVGQSDWHAAQEYLDKARQAARDFKATRLTDRLVNGLQARIWIARGELGLAEGWAQENGLIARPITEIIKNAGLNAAANEFVQSDYLALARLYLAQNKPDVALQVINPLLNAANHLGYMRRAIYILALKALALYKKKETELAVEVLGQALALGEPEGYQQVFLDEGGPMAQLLYQAIARGYSVPYTKKLLAEFAPGSESPDMSSEKKAEPDRLLEPLSEREQEVLSLIAAGLSNREMTLRLHISLSTVKGHIANIYGKLGVNSRTQALAEAIRLGILAR